MDGLYNFLADPGGIRPVNLCHGTVDQESQLCEDFPVDVRSIRTSSLPGSATPLSFPPSFDVFFSVSTSLTNVLNGFRATRLSDMKTDRCGVL